LGASGDGHILYLAVHPVCLQDSSSCPAEAGLLLACATTRPTPERTARARACIARIRNWDSLIALALRHAVMPLLYRYLTAECAAQLPAVVEAKLRFQFHLNVVTNRHLTNEVLRFMRAFEEAGVRALAFKGPLLAELAYGDAGLRQFADIDFLIDAHSLTTVAEILTAAGYRSHLSRRDGLIGGYFQEFEECFNGREGLGAVDVHWTMTPHAYPFAPSETAVRARAVNATLRGESVPTLAPDDLFLYLCVHGAKHGWCQLGWICDIAQLLAVPGLIDVATVLERAAPLGSRRMVLLAIYLAHAIGGVVEANLLDEARQSSAVVALGERAMRNLFTRLDGSLSLFDPWRVPFGAIEGAGSRARYVVRRLMAPTMGDFEMIPLPAALFPLYWVIRPFRMAVQYGPRLVRGAMGGAAAGSGNRSR